jgi:hypothetical protein
MFRRASTLLCCEIRMAGAEAALSASAPQRDVNESPSDDRTESSRSMLIIVGLLGLLADGSFHLK